MVFGQDNFTSQNRIVKVSLATGTTTQVLDLPYDSFSTYKLDTTTYLVGTTHEGPGVPKVDPDLHLYVSTDGADSFIDAFRRPILFDNSRSDLMVQFSYPNGDFPIQIDGYGTIVARLVTVPSDTGPPAATETPEVGAPGNTPVITPPASGGGGDDTGGSGTGGSGTGAGGTGTTGGTSTGGVSPIVAPAPMGLQASQSPPSADQLSTSPARTPAAAGGITRTGTGKANVLVGTAFDDVLRGQGGNDRLSGLAGNDRLYGGKGNDTLNGGAGKDQIGGGAGDDAVSARDQERDTISCGAGFDTVTGDRADLISPDCERIRRR